MEVETPSRSEADVTHLWRCSCVASSQSHLSGKNSFYVTRFLLGLIEGYDFLCYALHITYPNADFADEMKPICRGFIPDVSSQKVIRHKSMLMSRFNRLYFT